LDLQPSRARQPIRAELFVTRKRSPGSPSTSISRRRSTSEFFGVIRWGVSPRFRLQIRKIPSREQSFAPHTVVASTEPPPRDPVVSVSSLSKRYGEVVAVDDVTA
jgi:hypothetical protein